MTEDLQAEQLQAVLRKSLLFLHPRRAQNHAIPNVLSSGHRHTSQFLGNLRKGKCLKCSTDPGLAECLAPAFSVFLLVFNFLIVTKLYMAVFPFLTLAPLDSPLLAGIVIFYLGGEHYCGLDGH